MTHLLSSLLLPVSMNLDNFPIGMAYGIKGVHMRIASMLLITCLPAAGTALGIVTGMYATRWLSIQVANWVGSLIFITLGAWGVWDAVRSAAVSKNVPEACSPAKAIHTVVVESPEQLRHIPPRELLFLALALSVNNFGGGIGAGVSGLNMVPLIVLTILFGFLLVFIGYRVGRLFKSSLDEKWAGLVAGCLMMGVGVYELFV